MSFTLLSVVIICITLAVVYRQVRRGYKKGLSGSLIILASQLFCAVFSALVSSKIATALGKLLFEFAESAGFVDSLLGEQTMFSGIMMLCLNMIISLVLYLPVFFLMRLLLSGLIILMYKVLTDKNRAEMQDKAYRKIYSSEDSRYKVYGALVGVFSGLIVSAVVFMPLTGILKTATEAVDVAVILTADEEIENEEAVQLLRRYSNDVAVNAFHSCGSNVLYDFTVRTKLSGMTTTLKGELSALRSANVVSLMDRLRSDESVTLENLEVIDSLITVSRDSVSVKLIMTDFLKNASLNWMNNTPYLGIERPNLGNYSAVNEFLSSVLRVCSNTTVNTFEADMTTVVNLLSLVNEYAYLFTNNDYETFMKEFIEKDALTRIEKELSKNPNMRPLCAELNALVMNVIASEVMNDIIPAQTKNSIYKGIASVINDAKGLKDAIKLATVANGIAENLEENGIYLPDELKDRVTSVFTENINMDKTVTANDIENFLTQFITEAVTE